MISEEGGAAAAPESLASGRSRDFGLLAFFGATLFLSALLLFSVQPLFTRLILPRLGGTPAVWSVAMVFFQGALLAGYLYAHLLIRHLRPWQALAIHAAIMTAALLWLPVGIAEGFETPPQAGLPVWLLTLLAASIGMPFFAVAANAPLLQAWFARTEHPHRNDPYFLYGASNLGSLFALLSYPVLAEPLLALGTQARFWSALYVGLILAVLACGLLVRASATPRIETSSAAFGRIDGDVVWRERMRWVALAFLPSALLIAITAHLSTNIAAVPFLWVLPLAVFLLTFVLAFQRAPIVPARWAELMVPLAVVAAILTYGMPDRFGGLIGIAVSLAALFVVALAWHSALVASRPTVFHLTDFYLCMSAGGVLGGAFTSLAAPVLFDSVIEFPLLLVLALLVVPEARSLLRRGIVFPAVALLSVAVLLLNPFTNVEYRDRSFFGVVSTRLVQKESIRVLVHGTIVHGAEHLAEVGSGRRPEPLTYYAAGGPLAAGIALQQIQQDEPLQVAIVGLGVGSLACYRQPGEAWRFFEIDPAVITVATNPSLFTFLKICAPDAPIVPGDARLSLAHEPDAAFDVLVIDAFSSDSIPVHLLTREALQLYARKVGPDGIVLMHISNQFMELASVVAAAAAEEGLTAARMLHRRPQGELLEQKLSSDVVVLAQDPSRIEPYVAAGWKRLQPRKDVAAWTDDFSNVIGAILRKQGLL